MIASHSERKPMKSVSEIVTIDDVVAEGRKVHANIQNNKAVEQRWTAADSACALLPPREIHVEESAISVANQPLISSALKFRRTIQGRYPGFGQAGIASPYDPGVPCPGRPV